MEYPFVRSAYNYDRMAASNADGINCQVDVETGESTPSRTQQSFRDECDINTIVRRFGLTGQMPTNLRMPEYGDYSGVVDFKTAMDAVGAAREGFERLPAEVRARFHNEPQELLEFLGNGDNREEAAKLGLVPQAAVVQAADLVSSAPAVAAKPAAPAVAGRTSGE